MSSYVEGQIHQLVNAMEEAKYTTFHLTLLGQNQKLLGQIKDVLDGKTEIKPIEHFVDCDADPIVSGGWEVEEHKKGGVTKIERRGDDLFIGGKKVELYLSKCQCGGKFIGGHQLRKEVSKKEVKNVCILSYLMNHRELIPESWKKNEKGDTMRIFFWGTIYCDWRGNLYVGCLYWEGSGWGWAFDRLDGGWYFNSPAAVSVG